MRASIHIVVLLCAVAIEAQQTSYTTLAHLDLYNENYNRGRRQTGPSAIRFPNKCDRAVLSCCADTEQRQKTCFRNFRCTYDKGNACAKETILKVLDYFDVYTSNTHNKQFRRKRWNYYDDHSQSRFQTRRDSNPKEEEPYLPQIVRLLEEISTYVKNPQPVTVPHPIYVPYPVPYPVPQSVLPTNVGTVKVPDIFSRGFPVQDNTAGGLVKSSGGDDKDGARPISFVPIKPDRVLRRLAPNVEHGSVQADVRLSSSSPTPVSAIIKPTPNTQSPCTTAILACCAENIKKQQSNCFFNFQCGIPYDNGNACKSDSVRAAVDLYQSTHLL